MSFDKYSMGKYIQNSKLGFWVVYVQGGAVAKNLSAVQETQKTQI